MFYIRFFKIFLSKWLEPVLSHVFWFSFQFMQVGFLAMPLKISAFLSDMKERSCSQKPWQFFSFHCVSVSVCLVEDVGSSCKACLSWITRHQHLWKVLLIFCWNSLWLSSATLWSISASSQDHKNRCWFFSSQADQCKKGWYRSL